MGFYLRDKHIQSVEIDEARLRQLVGLFEGFHGTKKAGLTPEQATEQWFLSHIIRFDEKGYRVFSMAELIDLFNQGRAVERVVIALDSKESLRSNRQIGTWAELKLDAFAPANSWCTVTSDIKGDVDAAFAAIDDALKASKSWSGVVRSAPARLAIQLVGVILFFVISLWGGSFIASRLAIQNAFPIAFLFVFVLFSNAWTFLHPGLLRQIDKLFPNVYFKRPNRERWTWLWQALVGGAVLSVLTALALIMFGYVGSALEPLILKK